jgi:hypothetical protein
MKFLAVSTNRGDPTPWIAAESERMAQLASAGTIQSAFLKTDYSGAVFVVEAPDAETASTDLGTLPLTREGITAYELTPIIDLPQI